MRRMAILLFMFLVFYTSPSLVFAQDVTPPNIDYIPPTPGNGNTTNDTWVFINVTVTDANYTYGFTNFNNNLVGWWRMDKNTSLENDTHVYDWSGNGNNGTVKNGANPTTSGRFGGGFTFFNDNVDYDDNIEIAETDIGEGSTELTISAWVKSDYSDSGNHGIVSKMGTTDVFDFIWDSGENIIFFLYNTTGHSVSDQITDAIMDTGWHHAVARYNTTHIEVFVDGVGSGSPTEASNITPTGTNTLKIGNTEWDNDAWNGTIDEVLIFNRSLSAEEIESLYNSSSPRFRNNYTDLTNYSSYSFQSFAVDAGGNKNQTEERTINVIFGADIEAPSISVASPNNQTYITGNINYNITVSEALTNAMVSIDGGSNMTMDNSSVTHYYNLTTQHPTLSEGQHYATFWANDTAGNQNTATVYFYINETVTQYPIARYNYIQVSLDINDTVSTVFVPGVGTIQASSIINTTYTDPPNYFLTSEKNNLLRALVFQEQYPVSLILNRTGFSHILTINQSMQNSKIFLVFSNGGFGSVSNKIGLVESGGFLNNYRPSFGFGLGNTLPLMIYASYPDFNITGNAILQRGEYRAIAEHLGIIANKPVINFRVV